MCIVSCGFVLSGCSDKDYSKTDIQNLYVSILTTYCDESGLIDISIDNSKITQTTPQDEDKNYIFDLFYNDYVKACSGLFFTVSSRQGNNIEYVLQRFNQGELNTIYNKLNGLKVALSDYDKAKYVYESTQGDLYYEELIRVYNTIISNLINLNTSFSTYYFNNFYVNFLQESVISDGAIKDIMWHGLLEIAKVAYNYDVLNFVFENPYGEVNSWYNNTKILKNFMSLYSSANSNLLVENIENNIASYQKERVLVLLKNVYTDLGDYYKDYNLFITALNGVNLKEYLKQDNKDAYIEKCSINEKSYFSYIDDFISGRFGALYNGIQTINSML